MAGFGRPARARGALVQVKRSAPRYAPGVARDEGERRDGEARGEVPRRGRRDLVFAAVLAAACVALVRVFFFTHP